MSLTPDPATPQPIPATPAVLPPENRTRGTLLALLIFPAGIIVWVIVAYIGFISGIVALGIAVGALALYRFGSGGRISFNGAARVSAIIIVTLVVSYIASLVALNQAYFGRALRSGKFFEGLNATIAAGGGDSTINILLVVVFAGLGVFTVFRTAIVQSKQLQPPA